MSVAPLLDEINRLFEEMIHAPWSRQRGAPQQPSMRADKTFLEVEMPISEDQRGDVSVGIEGSVLIVTLRRRTEASGRAAVRDKQEVVQRSFSLPTDSDVAVIETHFHHDVLKVRVGLRQRNA
jgi:HSP20 family molecular chaperone IbpA